MWLFIWKISSRQSVSMYVSCGCGLVTVKAYSI